MQQVALVQEAQLGLRLAAVSRIQDNILARAERDVLAWLCLHMPPAVTPDKLTGFGACGAALVFFSYAATRLDPAFFWVATLGIVIHWLGDSLDGSLARYRQIIRPRYGYFLDHSVDALCNLTIMAGAGLSAYIRLDVALFALLGYFMLCMYVFLYNHVSHRFQLSFLALGPTELRLGLIGINCWMYFGGDLRLAIGGAAFSPYDLVLCGAGLIFVCLFAVNVFNVARKLRLEETSPNSPAGNPANPARSAGDVHRAVTECLSSNPEFEWHSRPIAFADNRLEVSFGTIVRAYRRDRCAARPMSGKKSA